MTDGRAEEREARWQDSEPVAEAWDELEDAIMELAGGIVGTVEGAVMAEIVNRYGTAAYEAGRRAEQAECMAVDERDGGYETWPVRGHVQKNDGSVFTPEEADALIDAFLDFWESRGMGFGGGIGVPTGKETP